MTFEGATLFSFKLSRKSACGYDIDPATLEVLLSTSIALQYHRAGMSNQLYAPTNAPKQPFM